MGAVRARAVESGAVDLGAAKFGAIDLGTVDLRALIARAVAADGAPPFSDQTLVDLAAGTRRVVSLDPAAVAVVGAGGAEAADAHGKGGGEPGSSGSKAGGGPRSSDGDRDGSAPVVEFELLVDPDARRLGHATRLLDYLLSIAPDARLAWAHGDLPGSRQLAARFGFEPVRELLQLRRDSQGTAGATSTGTTATAAVKSRPGLSFSTFDAERDADDWVELNARAFASHPEQGSVTRDDLDALTRTEWFDAGDFLLLRGDNTAGSRLIGYCWLKVEADQQPDTAVAEFYVVGVDPDRQGEGLGRILMEAGLAHVAGRGIRTSSLYVDGDNTSALALYRSLGFTQFAIDVQYERPAA